MITHSKETLNDMDNGMEHNCGDNRTQLEHSCGDNRTQLRGQRDIRSAEDSKLKKYTGIYTHDIELPLLCGENTDGGGGSCGTVTINGSFN